MGVEGIRVSTLKIFRSAYHLHYGHANFSEPSCKKQSLAAHVVSIHGAEAGILLFEIVGFFDRGADQHIRSHLPEVVEFLIFGSSIRGEPTLKLVKHDETFPESIRFYTKSKVEGWFGMSNGARVGSSIRDSQHNRVIIRSQPPSVISCHQRPIVIHGVRHADGVWYAGGSFLKSSEEGGQ